MPQRYDFLRYAPNIGGVFYLLLNNHCLALVGEVHADEDEGGTKEEIKRNLL